MQFPAIETFAASELPDHLRDLLRLAPLTCDGPRSTVPSIVAVAVPHLEPIASVP